MNTIKVSVKQPEIVGVKVSGVKVSVIDGYTVTVDGDTMVVNGGVTVSGGTMTM